MAGMPDTGTIAIDVGGTFTDITFADAGTGATWVAKTPSTPGLTDVVAGRVPLEQALREGNAEWLSVVRDPALQDTIGRKTAAFLAAGGQSAQGEKNYAAIRRAMSAA